LIAPPRPSVVSCGDELTADGRPLAERPALDAEGFTVASAGGGDFVVRIRRDAARNVAVS